LRSGIEIGIANLAMIGSCRWTKKSRANSTRRPSLRGSRMRSSLRNFHLRVP
jgi:hypothetical protein